MKTEDKFKGKTLKLSPIFVTLMKEAPGSSETSVLTRATWRNNPEDTILPALLLFVRSHILKPRYVHYIGIKY
jgi:hypothetical protein